MDQLYSNAKIILMGEYAVLHGADAVCMPLKTGQKLLVEDSNTASIHWRWNYKNETLAHFELDSQSLRVLNVETGDPNWAIQLIGLIRKQNPQFLQNKGTKLNFINHFPPQWGLGSSSATISSLCRLARVNPYVVNEELMGGSGADIACTTENNWFLYRKQLPDPGIWPIPYQYSFVENTYFVYSGNKQATANHLKDVSADAKYHRVSWLQANDYVYRFIAAPTIPEILKIVYDHELLISNAIGMDPIGALFPNFPGKVKSLGAWGGDFFMAISQQSEQFVSEYFKQKGYETIFNWDEFVEKELF
jgi:hypothetical protein